MPLHEWTETAESEECVITWLFEQDTFVPAAKLVANGECFSIISDYLGTPLQAYDKQGNKVWEQELDIYGRQRKRPSAFIPFKYQGQYEDAETGLHYNRFRYYDPNAGSYISQDPLGWLGETPTLYAYVSDINSLTDLLGLTAEVYKLVATKDGYYDVYEWGNDKPVGKTYLKKGDTWKIGETTNFRTRKNGTEIQNRYTKKWLNKNNLEYRRLQYSPNKSAKVSFQNYETSRIKKFEKRFGKKTQVINVFINIMDRVKITSDSPNFLKVSEISKELRLFSFVIETKYAQMDFDFVFCFRALYTTRGIRSKVRFEKDCNYLGMDLIMSEEEFHPYKKNIAMQRRIMGKHFFPFFAENIKKYRYKLPVLKPIEKDLVEDMRLFLVENLWLPDDSGSFKLSVIENVSYDRAMALFGRPIQKRFTDTDNGKIQDILWEVDEQTKLSAQYRLTDKVWTLECYKIE